MTKNPKQDNDPRQTKVTKLRNWRIWNINDILTICLHFIHVRMDPGFSVGSLEELRCFAVADDLVFHGIVRQWPADFHRQVCDDTAGR